MTYHIQGGVVNILQKDPESLGGGLSQDPRLPHKPPGDIRAAIRSQQHLQKEGEVPTETTHLGAGPRSEMSARNSYSVMVRAWGLQHEPLCYEEYQLITVS